MQKYKITFENQTVEFENQKSAIDYKIDNNLDVEIETFFEEVVTNVNYNKVVKEAINFGQNLIISFVAENVKMGITKSNKTKLVADYLRNVMFYAQSGSLYEILNEITFLENAGYPVELAPFVTQERINTFKLKIEEYLDL